jgi:hypothetical protein
MLTIQDLTKNIDNDELMSEVLTDIKK